MKKVHLPRWASVTVAMTAAGFMVACGGDSPTLGPDTGTAPPMNDAAGPDLVNYDAGQLPEANSSGPNWAVLDGPAFGEGAESAGLSKALELNVFSTTHLLATGEARATRDKAGSTYVYIAIPIMNVGEVMQCFIEISEMVYRRADGTALDTGVGTTSYITGTIGRRGSVETGTCLRPGDLGYVLDIESMPFDEVARLDFTLQPGDISFEPASAEIVPVAYEVSFESSSGHRRDTIEITAEHRGGVPSVVNGFSEYLLLGPNNEPLSWDFVNPVGEADAVVREGEDVLLRSTLIIPGTGSRLIAWLDYEPGETGSSVALANPYGSQDPGAEAAARVAARNRRTDVVRRRLVADRN